MVKDDKEIPPPVNTGKKNQTVKELFAKSKTKTYFLDAFCIFAKVSADDAISESDFDRKLKEFLNRPVK